MKELQTGVSGELGPGRQSVVRGSGFRPGMQFGKYSITRQLDGTTAESGRYLATIDEPSGSRACVIKQIPDAEIEASELRLLLEKEARIAVGLHHTNLVRIYEYGEVNGSYFLALEYVEGRTLEQVMSQLFDEGHRPSLPVILAIGLAISEVLDYLHEGVRVGGQRLPLLYHQLCPSNVLISAHGMVKLADFPLYRPSVGDLRRKAQTNLGYLAPERVMGLDFDSRADVFSLGVILGELLLGKPVFRRANSRETFAAILGDAPPSIQAVRPGLPSAVEEVVRMALARRRELRYASARSFHNDLAAIASQVDMSLAANELSALARNQIPSSRLSSLVPHSGVRLSPQTSAIRPIGFPEASSTREGDTLVVWIALITAVAVAGAVFFILRIGV